MPLMRIATMDERLADSLAHRRFCLFLLGIFAATAMVLAVSGLYGVMSYLVGQSTHEIGIRLALGAQPGNMLSLVLGRGLALTAMGLGIGIALSFAAARALTSLLFGVGTVDPVTLAGVPLLLAAVALLACYFPARRATRIDPLVALRCE
jgi:putative ABC transport system permease protein